MQYGSVQLAFYILRANLEFQSIMQEELPFNIKLPGRGRRRQDRGYDIQILSKMGGETQLYSQHWHTPNINYYRCFSIYKMKMWNGRHIFLFYWFSVFKTKYFLSPRIHKFKMTNFTDILGIYNPEVLLHTDLGPQTFD